ncbi:MAG: type II secretion system protein GspM [Pseudooceanicola sp.]
MALVDLITGMTPRERKLLGLLAFGVLPLAVVFLGLAPLNANRQAAHRNVAEAEQQLLWIKEQSRRYPPKTETDASGGAPVAGLAGLEQSLVASGLRKAVTGLTNRRAGQVDLRFDRIAFGALMPWLSGVEATAGYRPAAFVIEATDTPGVVAASMTLEPAQ